MKQHFFHANRGGRWGGRLLLGLALSLGGHLAQAQFGPVTVYSTGTGSFPRSLALADVNADSRPDIVTILGGTNTIGVMLGQVGGAFAAPVSYALGAGPHTAVLLADMNADGRLDIVTTNNANSAVEVLLGQVGGTFAAYTAYATGPASYPQGVAVADVNADGRPDIVTANTDGNTIGVLLGQASGGFAAVALYNAGAASQPVGVALGDVNADGRPDIVVSNSGTSMVGVLLGQAGGTFGAIATYAAGASSFPQGVALADVNADGRPDIIVANQDANAVGVLLGQVGGTFAAMAAYSTGANSAPRQVALADVNGDGRLDIVTANSGALNDTAGVLLGQAGGTFGAITTYSTGLGSAPRSVALADVNADRRPDIITVHPGTYGISPNPNVLVGGDAVGVLLNIGTYPLATAAAQSQLVALYPNPARGSCTVRGPGVGASAVLLNGLGQEVRQLALPTAETTLDLRDLAPGVYALRLLVGGELVTKRLVLE